MNKLLPILSLLPYALLILSIYLFFIKSDLLPWAILAFTLITINEIDENAGEKENKDVKKKISIPFRIIMSISIIFIILDNFFIELDASFVIYTILLAALTSKLILTNMERNRQKQ